MPNRFSCINKMSCLFDSLAPFVGMEPHQLRLAIVDYIQTNPRFDGALSFEEHIQYESMQTLYEYTEKMKRPTTMGGALEIVAFSRLFDISVRLHVPGRHIVIECKNNTKWADVWYTNSHYSKIATF